MNQRARWLLGWGVMLAAQLVLRAGSLLPGAVLLIAGLLTLRRLARCHPTLDCRL